MGVGGGRLGGDDTTAAPRERGAKHMQAVFTDAVAQSSHTKYRVTLEN